MLREVLCCCLVLTLSLPLLSTPAAEQTVQNIKETVLKSDIEGSKVQVKLRDGRRMTGRIERYGPDSFTLTASPQPLTFSYTEVEEIKQKRWPAVATVLIIVSAIVGSVALACQSSHCTD